MTQLITTTRLLCIILAMMLGISAALSLAQTTEDTGLYRVTTTRAAPGAWVEMRAAIEAQEPGGQATPEGFIAPYRIRHSQGDQWDFMLIQPVDTLSGYFADSRQTAESRFRRRLAELADFSEDWIVEGPAHDALRRQFEGAGLFHVEMFRARAGMTDELLDQRVRENGFLAAINETQNAIFVGRFGADWDVMTIGFHENLQSYAAGGGASDEASEAAARANGFDGVGTIAPFLRSLLVSHNDTLAVGME